MNKSIDDAELEKINGLTWLPWIGENYADLPNDKKILLIGESHYYDSKKESNHDGIPLFTRGIINRVINNKGTTTPDEKNTWKLFISTVKLLLPGSSEEQQRKFWSNVAFYNFVQRSVKEKEKEDRPSPDDFYKGWLTFFDFIKVIKPSVCILLGASSAQQFSRANQALKMNITLSKDKKMNGVWARSGTFSSDNGNTELVFIKHPSKYFSTDLWREYLEKKIPTQLEWLKDSINS